MRAEQKRPDLAETLFTSNLARQKEPINHSFFLVHPLLDSTATICPIAAPPSVAILRTSVWLSPAQVSP
ncbi:hypothetical protein VTJ04DRAFT_8157 [Mycothermus thermophilus]|uniref:uncharacterized protein n=1 Tax=Humicola insolens TaxID=85995 RepID=UPI0037446978